MIDAEMAQHIADTLREAADNIPIIQIATVLRERGREWRSAAKDLTEALENDMRAEIAMVGTIEPGMLVLGQAEARVLRVLNQGGQVSLQVNDNGFSRYDNYISATSPVVVLA